ncbi:uncharacterized protein LOC131334084 [Rhododendron vialii]|uniref:uncharacterized protein LOC131334084 n=1 Tax=Rhododendron vialii TaxID=182163 RepID=UPI00265E8263|nr:uncharacterized protein LOC131334084 [Rhododendron vialii]
MVTRAWPNGMLSEHHRGMLCNQCLAGSGWSYSNSETHSKCSQEDIICAKHLNSKWGSSSVAIGDPMLFPYNIQLEKLNAYKRWTVNDIGISAGDVYAAVECPSVFGLRYGWFSELCPKTVAVPSRSTHLGNGFQAKERGCSTILKLVDIRKEEVLDFKPTNLSKLANATLTTNICIQMSQHVIGIAREVNAEGF